MKKFLIILFTLVMSACGKKDGGGSTNPGAENANCVFSILSNSEIQAIHGELASLVSEKFTGKICDLKVYENLSSQLVFKILEYKREADIMKAIENGNIEGFLYKIFDPDSCEITDVDPEQINSIKQCQWEK